MLLVYVKYNIKNSYVLTQNSLILNNAVICSVIDVYTFRKLY